MTPWRRLTLSAPSAAAEELAVALHEEGALGSQQDGDLTLAWLPEEIDPDQVVASLKAHRDLAGLTVVASELEADGRWNERWLETLAPIPVGRRLVVVPGRKPPGAAHDGRHPIHLTPGRAFGTGEHATTRLCLELLEDHAGVGVSVLDVGTGSGILAIGAWILGCRPVIAIDTDPEAIAAAARNARRNASAILLAAGGIESLSMRTHDLVLANLTGAALERLLPELAARTGRRAILSGILLDEEAAISRAAAANGLALEGRRSSGDWCALELTRDAGV